MHHQDTINSFQIINYSNKQNKTKMVCTYEATFT